MITPLQIWTTPTDIQTLCSAAESNHNMLVFKTTDLFYDLFNNFFKTINDITNIIFTGYETSNSIN